MMLWPRLVRGTPAYHNITLLKASDAAGRELVLPWYFSLSFLTLTVSAAVPFSVLLYGCEGWCRRVLLGWARQTCCGWPLRQSRCTLSQRFSLHWRRHVDSTPPLFLIVLSAHTSHGATPCYTPSL